MTFPLGARARPLLATAAAVLVLAGCSDDGASEPAPPATSPTGPAECDALIPDSVLTDLGWVAEGAPTVDDGTCTKTADAGSISVQRRPVPATSEDELPDAASEQFDERCAVLGSTIDDVPGEEVDWLGDGRRACAALAEDGAPGTSSLLALVSDSVLMEFRIASDVELPAADAQTALTALAEATPS